MANKTIQVRLDEKLLDDMNKYSRQQGKTRIDFVREACEYYVARLEESDLECRYAEIYQELTGTTEAVDITLDRIPVEVSPFEA